MKTFYHVAKGYEGGNLQSLYNQFGDEAVEMFEAKWPECGDMSSEHCTYVHMHYTLDQAKQYQKEFGGEILEITLDEEEYDYPVVEDRIEYPHPIVQGEIEEQYIVRVM